MVAEAAQSSDVRNHRRALPGRTSPGVGIVAFSLLWLVSSAATAGMAYTTGPLAFATENQSMWGPGPAQIFEDEIFVGAEWNNLSWGIGGIVGSVTETTVITNPLWWAWRACKDTVDFLCGSEPAKGEVKSTVDTRSGARVDLESSGKLGLEFGYTVDAGSVNASAEYSAEAVLPNVVPMPGEFFSLDPSSSLDDGSISSQSPKAEAYVNAIAELEASVTATACLIFSGCAVGAGTPVDLAVEQPIVVVDPNSIKILPDLPAPLPDPLADIKLFNQELTVKGTITPVPSPPFALPGFKLTTAFGTIVDTSPTGTPEVEVDVASLETNVPDIATSGGLDGDVIRSGGRDDVLKARIDIDGVAIMAGFPPVGIGASIVDVPGFKVAVQFDALDVDAGPDLGITQDFELVPTLMSRVDFSSPVLIDGVIDPQSFWEGPWDSLPTIALLETTTFTPTFWIDMMLTNSIGIDLGLTGTMDLLKFKGTVTVAGIELLNIGPFSLNNLLGLGNELFSTPKLGLPIFDDSFTLGGFNTVEASTFTIEVLSADVPEPGTLLLMLLGLWPVVLIRRAGRSRFLIPSPPWRRCRAQGSAL